MVTSKTRIALLFGSFNPIHIGHLNVGKYTLDKNLADEVWYIVSPENPLKCSKELAPFEHRYKMAKLAIENYFEGSYHKRVSVSDIEDSLPRPSYTYNTIKKLTEQYTDEQYCFSILCGSDIDSQLPQWYKSEELQTMVDFIIYPRIMDTISQIDARSSESLTNAPLIETQACNIRIMLQDLENNKQNILNHTPSIVLDYIIKNNLYQG